ncbi:MAG: RidA family protein [Gammaproteobacteria bacterium]
MSSLKKIFNRSCSALVLLGAAVFSIGAANAESISRDYINPANGYTQVVAVSAHGVMTLYTSGQVSEGDTLEDQLRGTFAALKSQLNDAGAGLKDIVKMNTYIVNYDETHLATFRDVRNEFFAKENRPASTLVGVTALALPKYLVEIEVTAVIAADKD